MSAPAAENFLTPQNLWKPLAIIAALAFAYYAVLAKLGRDWWDDPNYSHGLLVPFIIGYILWTERERLMAAVKRPSLLWGGAGVACALLALWAGTGRGGTLCAAHVACADDLCDHRLLLGI